MTCVKVPLGVLCDRAETGLSPVVKGFPGCIRIVSQIGL